MHLAAVWEPSPAQPPRHCVRPQGERGSVCGLKGLIHRPRERSGTQATRPGRAVGLNRSTVPTEGHRPFPDRLWRYHGLVGAKGILCLLWTTCRAPPPPQREVNPDQRDRQQWPDCTVAERAQVEDRAGPRSSLPSGAQATPLRRPPVPQSLTQDKCKEKLYSPFFQKSIVDQGDPKVTCSGVAGMDLQLGSIEVPGIWSRKLWCRPPELGTALSCSSGTLGP